MKNGGGCKKIGVPKLVSWKNGGILPLIPIFADLSVLESLAGGASGIAKTVINAKKCQE